MHMKISDAAVIRTVFIEFESTDYGDVCVI